jgi:hypothetical protein
VQVLEVSEAGVLRLLVPDSGFGFAAYRLVWIEVEKAVDKTLAVWV